MNARLTHKHPAPQPRSTIRPLQLLPLLLWAGATTEAANPQADLRIYGNWQNSHPPSVATIDEQRQTYTSPVSVSGPNLNMTASVQPGIIKGSISGSGSWFRTGNPPDTWVVSRANGGVQVSNEESLTLAIPGLSMGVGAEVTFSYYLPGHVAVSHSGRADAGGDALWQTGGGIFARRAEYHIPGNIPPDVSSDTFPADRIVTVTRTVAVGMAFSEGQLLRLDGVSQPGAVDAVGSSSFSLDFSAYWNGVSQVTVGGVPVSSYSLVNSDGVNFNNSFVPEPVPEPGHCAGFAAAGLLAFGLWRRHSRRA